VEGSKCCAAPGLGIARNAVIPTAFALAVRGRPVFLDLEDRDSVESLDLALVRCDPPSLTEGVADWRGVRVVLRRGNGGLLSRCVALGTSRALLGSVLLLVSLMEGGGLGAGGIVAAAEDEDDEDEDGVDLTAACLRVSGSGLLSLEEVVPDRPLAWRSTGVVLVRKSSGI
jgi:hypothetical protein